MEQKEAWIFNKGQLVKVTKWKLFTIKIKRFFSRYKIYDTRKYILRSYDDLKYYFRLSKEEYIEAQKIYKEKGTISYEFYPCGGVGWGVKVHTKDEVIDITDYNNF